MHLVRDPEEAALADLNAFGGGLLERYERLLNAGLDEGLSCILRELIDRRRPLLEALADREAARGDPPKAADREVNELRAATDRLSGALFGPELPFRRVAQAETAWRQRLKTATGLDWSGSELDLFESLTEEAEAVRTDLEAFDPQT